jgi:hypothetical protein
MLSNDDRDRSARQGKCALNRRRVLFGGTALAAASAFAARVPMQVAQAQQPAAARSQPNILFMLADNLGYGVPSCYNGGILA